MAALLAFGTTFGMGVSNTIFHFLEDCSMVGTCGQDADIAIIGDVTYDIDFDLMPRLIVTHNNRLQGTLYRDSLEMGRF